MPTIEPFDQLKKNLYEKVLSADFNESSTMAANALYETAGELLGIKSTGLAAPFATLRGLGVTSGGGMTVNVAAGLALYNDTRAAWLATDYSTVRPVYVDAIQTLTVPASDPSNARIDLVVIRPARYEDDPKLAEVVDPNTGVFSGSTVNVRYRHVVRKTATYADLDAGTAELAILEGTPSGSPVAPTPAAGETALCQIAVGASVGSISDSNITDARPVSPFMPQPSLTFRVQGSSGSFSFSDVDKIVERGGATLSNVTRATNGNYTLTYSGLGDAPLMFVQSMGTLISGQPVATSLLNPPTSTTAIIQLGAAEAVPGVAYDGDFCVHALGSITAVD